MDFALHRDDAMMGVAGYARMNCAGKGLAGVLICGLIFLVTGCETVDKDRTQREAIMQAVLREVPGDYFVGRRMYKEDYKMWGWVRPPRQPWSKARLVMLNEQRVLAPDRAANKVGSDNGFEYRLGGYFSGETVYEPASDGFYPEFVLTGYELLSTNPPNIYRQERQNDPKVRLLSPPIY